MRALWLCLITIGAACGGTSAGGDDDGSPDAANVCAEGTTQCTGNSFQRCDGGEWVVTEQCPATCNADLGCIACNPDQRYCDGETVMQCNGDGTGGTVLETCEGGAHCLGGVCVDLCADAAANKSYIGCEYYAVDLDNAVEVGAESTIFGCAILMTPGLVQQTLPVCYDADATHPLNGLCDPDDTCPIAGYECTPRAVCVLDAAHSPFAIVVSNPQTFAVNVTLSNATGTTQTVEVPAGAVQSLLPQTMGFTDQSLDRSMQGKSAYRLVSDAPVVAYQFNPLDNANVFSNDASLLIPRTTWDTEYYVMSWPTLERRTPEDDAVAPQHDYNGYLSIVAAEDDTMIEVTPTAATRANGAIAAIAAGTPTAFTLDAFEVLTLEAGPVGDLTGSFVRSVDGKPIGVFGGHEAIAVEQSPAPNAQYPRGPCCADHVEEMMFPASTWGKEFAIARSKQRNGEPDRLRVIAQKPGTTVTFDPSPASGACATLDAGQFCEVKINVDTVVSSNEPVLVGHYLESVIWQDVLQTQSIGNGDPSMSLAVPTEQYRTDYRILVPAQYTENHVAIATTAAGTVSIDGADVTGQLAAFGGEYRGGRIAVTAGAHEITCSAGCGIEVMGYSSAVSYLFAGGLDLQAIVVD